REVTDAAFLLQIGEMLQRIEIAPVAVIPPMELQQVETLDPHAPQRPGDRLLDGLPANRSGIGNPFGEGLDLVETFGAALRGEALVESADQILGRTVMVGEIPGREAGIMIIEHRRDGALRVNPAMRP